MEGNLTREITGSNDSSLQRAVAISCLRFDAIVTRSTHSSVWSCFSLWQFHLITCFSSTQRKKEIFRRVWTLGRFGLCSMDSTTEEFAYYSVFTQAQIVRVSIFYFKRLYNVMTHFYYHSLLNNYKCFKKHYVFREYETCDSSNVVQSQLKSSHII